MDSGLGCDLNLQPDETALQYIWRLGGYRENGIIEMTWSQLAEIMNKNLREPDEYLTESAFRKKYATMRQAYAEIFEPMIFEDTGADMCEEIVQLRRELEKERVKLRDEKTDYRRLIREQARKETLNDILAESLGALNEKFPLIQSQAMDGETAIVGKDYVRREAIACFADWHYGMVTNNVWNKYNPDICKQRVQNVIRRMRDYIRLNNIKALHCVLLGDAAHGVLHLCNIGSTKDVCDQIMEVSEIVAEAINDLSSVVDNVIVHTCYGNHLRTAQNKQDALSSDNMEKLIPWWLEQRLKDNHKVTVEFSEYKEFTLLNVVGYNIVCVHGNGFNFKDIGIISNIIFNKMFGKDISYTISGDKHHFEECERMGIESILVSSLCGTDNYANDQHLYGKAGQTLMIFNEEYGRECTYHIPADI